MLLILRLYSMKECMTNSFIHNELLIGKDLDGSGDCLIMVLSQKLLEGLRKSMKNLSHVNHCPSQDSN
jgi:hypothetical protein